MKTTTIQAGVTAATLALVVLAGVVATDRTLPAASDSRGTDLGAHPVLRVVADEANAYLRFELAGLAPGTRGSDVERATLRLFVERVGRPGTLHVLPVWDAWDADSVTASPPSLVAHGQRDVRVGDGDSQSWLELDVTWCVRAWLDGSLPPHGLALVAGSPGFAVDFQGGESAPGGAPRLDLDLVPVVEPGDGG